MKQKWLYIVLLLSCALRVQATPMTTEGTEFYLTFMTNLNHRENSTSLELKLLFSARETGTVTVSNPQTGWQTTLTVAAHTISECPIPLQQGYAVGNERVEKKGLRVTSTTPISLYASNYADASNDATNILPVTALSGYYIMQTYESVTRYVDYADPSNSATYAKEFIIVATDNNTNVTIIPHAKTMGGKTKNRPFSVRLNKGEVYQVLSEDDNSDFSGTVIQASVPVAVFAGHQCASIAADEDWCDHIVEQSVPTSMWGKRFAVTKTMGQYRNRVLVTAQNANTSVALNGMHRTTLGALETYEFEMPNDMTSCFIETSEPASCYLYTEGGRKNNKVGDPSSVYISPVEQFVNNVTFATLKTERAEHNYVNIVLPTDTKSAVRLDGNDISARFSLLEGNSSLSYARIEIPHGIHTLTTPENGFSAYVYGLGDGESYAYMVGASTNPLDVQMLIDGKPGAQFAMNTYCSKHMFEFAPQVNGDYTTVMWDFGDGTSITQDKPKHSYSNAGDYEVQMTVISEAETKIIRQTLHLSNDIRDTIDVAICDGQKYTFNGHDYTTSGIYPAKLKSKDGCDSTAVLRLTVGDTYRISDTKYLADGQTIKWRGYRIATPGIYRDTLPTASGCDSIFELNLLQTNTPKEQHDTLCYEPTYLFMGHEYPIPPVDAYSDKEYVDYVLEYRDELTCEKFRMFLAIVPNYEVDSVCYDTVSHGTVYKWRGMDITKSGTYYDEEELGCHSTKHYTLHLVVKPYPIVETEATLCTTDTYIFRDRELKSPGVYSDTVFSAAGIGAIYRLTLTDKRSFTELYVDNVPSYDFNGKTLTQSGTYRDTISNAAGCDSIITLYLGINGKCTVTEEISQYLCEESTIEWNEQTCSPGNSYNYRTTSTAGCDSIVTLHILPLEKKQTHLYESICEGDYFRVGEERLTEAGPHTVILQSAEGCDSIVTVELTINKNYNITRTEQIVYGQSFIWDGDVYTEEGEITKEYVTQDECDSVETVYLSVIKTIYSEFTKEICDGDYYEWNGEKLNEHKDYQHTYLRPGKADSVVTLHLIVRSSYDMPSENVTVKELDLPYIWEKENCYESKIYSKNLKTKNHQCDSIIHLNLTVLPTIYKTLEPTICNGSSFYWKGELLEKSTDDTQTIRGAAANDNDTIVTLHLTVLSAVKQGEETITLYADQLPFLWHGQMLTEFKDYTDNTLKTEKHNCDSSVVLHLIEKIKPVINLVTEMQLCAGKTVKWYGQTCDHVGQFDSELHKGDEADTIYTLHLTYYDAIPPTTLPELKLCYGESYKWLDEATYSTSQLLTYTLPSTVTGCDSVINVQLTIYDKPEEGHEYKVIYTGDEYEWNGQTYKTDGVYPFHTTDIHNCDSTAWLHLTVSDKPVYDSVETVIKCDGETFLWQGQTIMPTAGNNTFTARHDGTIADTVIVLTVLGNPVYPNVEETQYICEGDFIDWNGIHCDEAKDYTATLKTVNGCDSIVTLHLKHYPAYDNVIDVQTVCEGTPYEWQGEIYSQSTTITKNLKTIHNCDSVVTLKLTVNSVYHTTDEEVILCHGKAFKWNDETYSTSGTYTQTLQSSNHCDSIVTRTVTILPVSEGHEYKVIYTGDEYEWNGQTYKTDGVYPFHTTDIHNCDSTAWLHLTVSDKLVVTQGEAVTVCEGRTYNFHGEILTAETSRSYTCLLSGEEADTLVTLTMTVLPIRRTAWEKHLCEGEIFVWNGLDCSAGDTYTQTFEAADGCDSVVTLTVQVHPAYKTLEEKLIYTGGAYTWQGVTYTESTEVTKTLESVYGCDSIVTFRLAVSEKPLVTREMNASVCEGEFYSFYDEVYSQADDYETLRIGENVDTLVTLHLAVLPRYEGVEFTDYVCEGTAYNWEDGQYAEAGDYSLTLKSKDGCDSVVTLHLKTYPRYEGILFVDTIIDGAVYEWDGRVYGEAGDYPYTYLSQYGCDSVVTLRLTRNHVEVYEVDIARQCAEDGLLEIILRMTGVVHQVSLRFDERAVRAGLRDTTVSLHEGGVSVPYHARAGRYTCALDLLFRRQVVRTDTVSFALLYPSSVLEQAWNDVVAVLTPAYNGGYDFTAFQWYENGEPLDGETGSYLYRPLQMGAEYAALLTDTTGMQLMTCPLVATEQAEVSLFPTVADRGQFVRCRVSEPAELTLYDATGKCLLSQALEKGDTPLAVPAVCGMYMAHIMMRTDSKARTVKLIVR